MTAKINLNHLPFTLPVPEVLQVPMVAHKGILSRLLKEVQPIDFVLLIKPQAVALLNQYNDILAAYREGKVIDTPRFQELEQVLQSLRAGLKQRHYVVCIISELLKLAAFNHWDLCKCYDYVYVYNGTYWKQLDKDDLKYFLGEAAIRFGYPEIDAIHHIFKDELLRQFMVQAHLPTPEQAENTIAINLQNGTFKFIGNKWQLSPFNPKDFITYQLPFAYRPEASCPLFDRYLEKVLPDTDSRLILQEFAGFIFTKLNLERCLVLTGGGSNGKSVFFNILNALIGRDNVLNYPMGLFNSEYNRAKLVNVLLNYSSEKGMEISPDTFKALVSGEPLQAREPYGKSFTINNKVRFILNCNELPKETESTEAFFRRYLILPFDVKISEADRDIHLADKIISSELTGVFNWLLVGLSRLMAQQKFTDSKKVNDALTEYKRQSDSVALFTDEQRCRVSTLQTLVSDLYSRYRQFCNEDGYRPVSKNKFSSRMESKGFEKTRRADGSRAFYMEYDLVF